MPKLKSFFRLIYVMAYYGGLAWIDEPEPAAVADVSLNSIPIRNFKAGDNSIVSTSDCLALGDSATCIGIQSVSLGSSANAAASSVTIGYNSDAAVQSVAVGAQVIASAINTAAIGFNITNSTPNTSLIGTSTAGHLVQPSYQFMCLPSNSEGASCGLQTPDASVVYINGFNSTVDIVSTRFADGGAVVDLANNWITLGQTQQKYTVCAMFTFTMGAAGAGNPITLAIEWFNGATWVVIAEQVYTKPTSSTVGSVSATTVMKTNSTPGNRVRLNLNNALGISITNTTLRFAAARIN